MRTINANPARIEGTAKQRAAVSGLIQDVLLAVYRAAAQPGAAKAAPGRDALEWAMCGYASDDLAVVTITKRDLDYIGRRVKEVAAVGLAP